MIDDLEFDATAADSARREPHGISGEASQLASASGDPLGSGSDANAQPPADALQGVIRVQMQRHPTRSPNTGLIHLFTGSNYRELAQALDRASEMAEFTVDKQRWVRILTPEHEQDAKRSITAKVGAAIIAAVDQRPPSNYLLKVVDGGESWQRALRKLDAADTRWLAFDRLENALATRKTAEKESLARKIICLTADLGINVILAGNNKVAEFAACYLDHPSSAPTSAVSLDALGDITINCLEAWGFPDARDLSNADFLGLLQFATGGILETVHRFLKLVCELANAGQVRLGRPEIDHFAAAYRRMTRSPDVLNPFVVLDLSLLKKRLQNYSKGLPYDA